MLLTRREFLKSLAATASLVAVGPSLALVLPKEDSWRFGKVFLSEGQHVYYGIDIADPEQMVMWRRENETQAIVERTSLEKLEGEREWHAVAEIKMSQGMAGLRSTGGLMVPGDPV